MIFESSFILQTCANCIANYSNILIVEKLIKSFIVDKNSDKIIQFLCFLKAHLLNNDSNKNSTLVIDTFLSKCVLAKEIDIFNILPLECRLNLNEYKDYIENLDNPLLNMMLFLLFKFSAFDLNEIELLLKSFNFDYDKYINYFVFESLITFFE